MFTTGLWLSLKLPRNCLVSFQPVPAVISTSDLEKAYYVALEAVSKRHNATWTEVAMSGPYEVLWDLAASTAQLKLLDSRQI